MIGLLQRVTHAQVMVAEKVIAKIGPGLLVLVGIEREDGNNQANRLLERLLNYRLFADTNGRMNLSLIDTQGGLLLVPQFTLAADTQKGARPSFTSAAPLELSESLFNYLFTQATALYPKVAVGQFGAHMQVSLTNDGPVTFTLRVPPNKKIITP
ncbi:D-tyrosyl-tRNA(Tyr) deacylase [Candidatus Nitrosoglobus terrae]|uniref:D-aminoacyl-tRNA deacylase n=1 Tax=Candidatus Nitrosoglobus terrae TaxID=1630141 RepID=A0A1Q2SLD6_9GAMM|nr:D-aminoacyl-tRNA deacylase [Candidatus Nitrosoglobus terrae]BAW79938.1 D-tyrosyl-tRNA(Tyr) deacylase [Candidatus Nitrosoglobus terrae]